MRVSVGINIIHKVKIAQSVKITRSENEMKDKII